MSKILVQLLLCTRHYARCYGHSGELNIFAILCSFDVLSLIGKIGKWRWHLHTNNTAKISRTFHLKHIAVRISKQLNLSSFSFLICKMGIIPPS